jgi:hypothetical protein
MNARMLDQCRQIQQNSTYSAEAHHNIASKNRRLARGLQIVPAILAAVSGAMVAGGCDESLLVWLTVPAAVVTAIASVLDPNRGYEDHLGAAKSFTVLKHDARFLHEAKAARLQDDMLEVSVTMLHERYNEIVRTAPPTSNSAFEKARKRVQDGVHSPDRNEDGTIR